MWAASSCPRRRQPGSPQTCAFLANGSHGSRSRLTGLSWENQSPPLPGKPQQPWRSGASYRGWRKLWTSAQFGGELFKCRGGPVRDWYPRPQTRGRMPGCRDRPRPPTPTPSVGDAPILPTSCKQHHHGHAHPRGRGLLVGSRSSTPHPTVPWQAAWGSLTFVSLSPLLASQPHPRVTPKDMK